MRLDAYAAEQWPEHSRATWQKYIKLGYVFVDGVKVTSPSRKVGVNETVTAHIPEAPDFSHQTLPVIYEDDDVIVINKPVGVLTHAKGAVNEEFSVAEFVRPLTTYKSDTNRPGIIHRLDRDTSGVLLAVKNEKAATMLQRQFTNRTVKKTYSAVVESHPKQQEALIDLPIGRNPKAPSTFRVDAGGKAAETHYKVVKTGKARSLVELKPKTGRTHQLRVHMQYIGTPIVGDRVYGKPADRLYLHAHQLELTLPNGQHHIFTAPVPPEFSETAV